MVIKSLLPKRCERAERPREGRERRDALKHDGFRAISRKAL
jgi:hypothetical protein